MPARSLNRVCLIGNLTRDPELKYTPSGTAVATIGLATNRSWVTATGETKEEVQYHRLVAWQKLAELAGKLLAKGRKVYCEGRLVYRNYTSKDGSEKSITEIVLEDFILLDSKLTGADKDSTVKSAENQHPAMDDSHEDVHSQLSQELNDEDIPF